MARHHAPSRAPAGPHPRLRPVALSLLCLGLAPALAQTLPTGFNPIAGAVSMTQVPGTMSIVQGTARGIVQWQSFSIGAGGTVNIAQPSVNSVLLNRVVGDELSTIAGALNANGHVFLINPNGVLFSKGAVVNVGGLVASTLDVGNAAFSGDNVARVLSKGDSFVFERNDGNAASVVNQGNITAGNGGIVALVGATVSNQGSINVAQGSIGLVSGRKLTLDYQGDGLTAFTIAADSKASNALVENTASGQLTADGGRVVLLAASTAAQLVVNQSGVVRARSLQARGGEIVLGAGDNANSEMRVAGTLDASGTDAGVAGGSVTASGGFVRLDGAAIDASGTRGGTVAVNAIDAVTMSPAASIRADASNGSGGSVSVESTGVTHISGSLSARGAGSGDGGTVTTSGIALEVTPVAVVDAAGGAAGANGQWNINSTFDLNVNTVVPAYDPAAYATNTTNTQVHPDAIGAALGRATDVTLNSSAVASEGLSNGQGVRFRPDAQVIKTEGRAATLTVNSVRNIEMNDGSGIVSLAGPLDVAFNADSAGTPLPETLPVGTASNASRRGAIDIQGASIETNGGSIAFYGQSNPVGGRAVGGYDGNFDGFDDGIRLTDSRLSTCAVGSSTACGGSGSISLRGQGATTNFGEGGIGSGIGVNLLDSELVTGAGAITVDGRGGLGSAGVVSGLQPFTEAAAAFVAVGAAGDGPLIQSGSGDITLRGSSRGWFAGDPTVDFSGRPNATSSGRGAGSGVAIDSTIVSTGGNIRIEGKGGDISGLAAQPDYLDAAAPFFVGGTNDIGAGNATLISYSNLTAGPGRSISISGTPGSNGFSITRTGAEAVEQTPDTVGAYGVSILGTPGNGLQAAGGRITIDGGNGNVSLVRAGADAVVGADGPSRLVSTASTTGPGGSIVISGRNVLIDGGDDGEGTAWPARIDSSGVGQAGSIDIHAIAAAGVPQSGVVALGSNSSLEANATSAVGNGGSIRALGDTSLRAYGDLSARGGTAGGNGGFIETSANTIALAGVRVDASAPAGTAGSWLVDPFDISIVPGAAAGTLPANPFVPVATSTIQDGDISATLNGGTSVTITTGAVGSGAIGAGNINLAQGVRIDYDNKYGPLTFRLDANRSIFAGSDVIISSIGDPLNVVLNANANGLGAANGGGGSVTYNGSIYSSGGNVSMSGSLTPPFGTSCSICLAGPVIDTRGGNAVVGGVNTGGSNANAGGSVTLTGTTSGPSNAFSFTQPAVFIDGTDIRTSTGDVTVFGSSTTDSGVLLRSLQGPGSIATTSGNVSITGIGSYAPNSIDIPGHGVLINGATVQSVNGDIAVHGLRLAGGANPGSGVLLSRGALVTTLGTGDIDITGEQQGNGAGVTISAFVPATPGVGVVVPAQPASRVDGNRNVVLRAANDGSTDALAIGGTVRAGNVLNLRPGGVDAAGNAVDRTANPITLGGTAATGFAVSGAEFAQLTAGTMVAGSNAHAANITVVGPLSMASPLTLQNGGGGNINLNAAVTAPQLGLLSAGTINQGAAAPITATTLVASSSAGNVVLDNPANNVGTLAGSAAGRFLYTDANALTLGAASVTGVDAASDLPQTVSAGATSGNVLRVRTLSGDLSLNGNVSSSASADLVAAARFQNLGTFSISGAPWRVWADTWVGETRGGLAGSGLLPNLYSCAYLGLCAVTVTPADNHFIYAQQPSATVVAGNASRQTGQPNPPFTYSITGLILGDTGAGFSGGLSSSATPGSAPGNYPITGSFVSAAGYLVNVVPGTLTVTAAPEVPTVTPRLPELPKVDVLRDGSLMQTYVYDRNIGQPPICFATGSLEGDRAEQTGDVLAREWSRVRSRPNLLSCVSTEKRNGCADF